MVNQEVWKTLMANERTMLQYAMTALLVIGLGFYLSRMKWVAGFLMAVGVMLALNGVLNYLIRRKKVLEENKGKTF